MANNRVELADGTVLMDISDTTAEASDVAAGKAFYSASGVRSLGTGNYMNPVANPTANDVLVTDANGQAVDSGVSISDLGTVKSVNGQTGTVVLQASDVGALPDDTDIPANTSDLTNDSGFITGMAILSYGNSNWQDFIEAYTAQKVVYCRASSGSNPASGSQTRLAFMAYVNNAAATSITEVEFQYYRSVSSHSVTQQGDQVYVYKLNKNNGWSVTVRENYTRITAGTNIKQSYSNGVLTLNLDSAVTDEISNAQKTTSHELYIHSGTTASELGRAIMLIYGKLFLLHGIVTVTTALSQGAVIYDLPSYNYGLANMNNNPIVAADNSSYTTVGVDNTNKTLKVTYNGGMPTGRFEMFLIGWIN